MPKLEMKTTHELKDQVLKHVADFPVKYRSVSHFMQEALLDRMTKDRGSVDASPGA